MNTNSKYRKISLIVLAVVLVALVAVVAGLSLFTGLKQNDYDNSTDIAISQTTDTTMFKEKPYVVAQTQIKAKDYAEKLGLEEGQYTYIGTSVLSITNGTWDGMANTTIINKYAHLLLPTSVKKIAINRGNALGTTSVKWVSITAEEGSQLEEFERGTDNGNAVFGNGGGWLERLDLSKASKLKSISSYTFRGCDRLYDVALPDTLTSIESYAFGSNGMTHISLPSGLGADGAGLDTNAFNYGNCKIADIELPANANATFVSKVKGMASIKDSYLNVYKKGDPNATTSGVTSGRSWLVTTNDGFIFCKNTSRTLSLATSIDGPTATINYATNKWYLVGYRGPESGGDALIATENYMVRLPEQVDLAVNGEQRKGAYDYIDCAGVEIKNDFSSLTGNTTTLGSNVAINGSSRVIAGTSNGNKLRYDIGKKAFYFRWVWHTTIPDNTVSTVGNSAFGSAPMNTFNCGNIENIGSAGLQFNSSTEVDLIFYAPSNNPNCATNGFTSANNSYNRLFVYRNYSDYDRRANYSAGLYARLNGYTGAKKYYTYLVDIVPNVAEWDTQANAYKYVAVNDEKITRLYAGSLSGYNSALYNNPYCYVRQSNDTWQYEAQSLPALTDYTGYDKTTWYSSTAFTTKYTETSIGTSTAVTSLRNVANSATDKINMYAKKIVSVTLENKKRQYSDRSLKEYETEITGIPESIRNDYRISVTKYVNSSGVEKSYESIGSEIREAGVYTIQIQPNANYGEWNAESVPTMTVTVDKTQIDLGDYRIFRLGVTNGVDDINLRPGKEVVGEQPVTLYQYNNSWYTDKQTDDKLGEIQAEKSDLWNSFVRAEGENINFSLTLVTDVIKDDHDSNAGIFTHNLEDMPKRGDSGTYTEQFTVTLTEKAQNNYKLIVTNDESRQFYGYADNDQRTATINKTWYIVRLNNWLTTQGHSGNEAPSYYMTVNNRPSWAFGTANLPLAPAVALGNPDNIDITFSIELTSPNVVGGTGSITIGSGIPISQYGQYINSSMPVGDYRVIYTVEFSNDDSAKYGRFQQSFSFSIYNKDFTAEEMDAINQLKEATFEYDMQTVTATYNRNDVLFDLSKLTDATKKAKLQEMLGLTNNGGASRAGIWAQDSYNALFDSHFEITYNLNRMWNNVYLKMDDIINGEFPMDTPDVYVVYYQLTCKNRESLINPNNNDRRQCYFNVVVYRLLTPPQGIEDIEYTGEGIRPTVKYKNGELEFEQSYYEVSFPDGQDDINTGDKKVILTIYPEYAQLYRWQQDKTKTVVEIPYKIIPAINSSTVPLYMASWSWGSEITLDNIIWKTKFGDPKDYKYTLIPEKANANDDREEVDDITKFGTATAGVYKLSASCPASKNWTAYSQEITIVVSPAVNTWYRSPSISTWSWNQYADYDWNSGIIPISLHAIPMYYTSSDESVAGSGRFDFRIYSIDSSKTGNDRYVLVEFGNDFHFQFEKDSNGEYIKTDDGHFVLPKSVAQTLAGLDAGQYYLVATVYSHINYTGLNNSAESFTEGAVPFTVLSANNIWTDTITAVDREYSEFELGLHFHAGATKYPTDLKYSICLAGETTAVTVDGVKLDNIADFEAKAKGDLTYSDLIKKLDAGSYTVRVHGDSAPTNDRGGVNFLEIDDFRNVKVTKASNTLNEVFMSFTYTIGEDTKDLMTKYTARFETNNVGYRISKGGQYVDELSGDKSVSSNPIKFSNALSYDNLLKTIAEKLESGDYTIWWTTNDGKNYEAQHGYEIITIYSGQNDWKDGVAPTVADWQYDYYKFKTAQEYYTAHEFKTSSVQLKHTVSSTIGVTYYEAIFNESTGQYERGSSLTNCPINVGNYLVAVNVPTDNRYNGMSVDLFFRINMADNNFVKEPAINNNKWQYSQLTTDDIVIGVPQHEETDMALQYVVYRTISGNDSKYNQNGVKDTEERMATLTWELGEGYNNNEISLEAFLARLNLLDVGEYKMSVTLSASKNFNGVTRELTLTVTQAQNGWKVGMAPTINNKSSWEWNNYDDSAWNDIETKFGRVIIYVNGNAVSSLSVSRYLSELEVGAHTIDFEVAGTDNYSEFKETVTFNVTQANNGWKDGASDKTAFVNDWTWGEYNNDIVGNNPTWVQPNPKYGTPYATIYKGQNGVGGTLIRSNIALYSLDIVMNFLDAGKYYIVWSIPAEKNFKAITREYINFEVKVNRNAWDPNKLAGMHENEGKDQTGIEYGWTWGEYGKNGESYFTMPVAKYGTTVATIVKLTNNDKDETPVVNDISNEHSIATALENLPAGRYILRWSAKDLQNTGNFKDIDYEVPFEFIVNRGVNSWLEGDKPMMDSWMWGAFKSSYWKAPGLQFGNPNATIYKLDDNGKDVEKIVENISAIYLNAQLEILGVGSYRIEWTADSEDNYQIGGAEPDDLYFNVWVNNNKWINAPAITARDGKWQWGSFTLGYWTTPSAEYHNNDMYAVVYKVDGDYIYNDFTKQYDFSNCVERSEITLDTLDKINDLSVGKYLIKVCVPDDTQGRYKGLEAVVRFEIVPNDNNFNSSLYYVNGYAYQEFRGYWRAPMAQFGEIMASIYLIENGVRGEKMYEVSTYDLNDVLRELHTGMYELDWTIVEDEEGNYLSHTRTSNFIVSKANNRWLSRPAIGDWGYGMYDSTIAPMAMPLAMDDDVKVYYKILNVIGGEIADFRAYAEKFTKDADGNYFNNGRLVLTADGYFTDIVMVAEVVKDLKPGIYHLIGYYPEISDYNRLDTNNDHLFEIRSIDNRWIELPTIKSWIAGSTPSLPQGYALHGKVIWMYYKAVYVAELDRYVISGEAVATGEYPPVEVGQYILVATTESVDGYAVLREEIFFEVFKKESMSGNLLLWIDIILATIASGLTIAIIHILLKARRRKDDEVFNG